MRKRFAYILTVTFLLGGSHLIADEKTPPVAVRDQIVVQLPCPKAEAIEKTLAAFVAEDLHVAKSEGGIATSVPVAVTIDQGLAKGMYIGGVTYSATVIGLNDKEAKVVLGATMLTDSGRIITIRSDMSKYWSKEKDRAKYAPIYVPFWQRVERIADRLQGKLENPEEK